MHRANEILAVVERLQARSQAFVDALLAELERRTPELVRGDPEPLEALRAVSVANFHFGLEGVRDMAEGHGTGWSRGEPADAAENARFMARRAVPLEVLLRAYRSAHLVGWDMTREEIMAAGFDEATEAMTLTGASHFQFDYFDHLISVVTQAYTREFERRTRGREQRRVQAVERVLAGEAADSEELGYRLEGHHVAMVVRGPEAEPAAQALAAAMGRETLVVSRADELAWLWLGSRTAFESGQWDDLCAHGFPGGIVAAAGESHEGVEGFRTSHRQAQLAARVARLDGDGTLVRYADMALLAGVLEHDPTGESFAVMVLGELAGPGSRCAGLRETLAAYFAAGHNASAAAAALGIGERAVRYRLRKIEEIIGRPVDARRPELEVALRALRAHGAPDDS